MPRQWNGHLVLHAHGGPALGAPRPERSAADLERWAIMVKAGYAWAGSTFRQGGVEVRAAAEDTERLRRDLCGPCGAAAPHHPARSVVGASVAARGAEMFTSTTQGQRPYDAVLLTSGVLAGGSRSYDFRTDLRVVYQYLCNNHPRPTEVQYPLNIGLPADATLTQADLAARVNECLGLDKPASARTPEQQRRVKVITDVIRIPASSIQGHMNWATFHFRDVVQHRTGGASPFGNEGVRYRGSGDDAALNAGVLRYRAHPAALARFAQDTDPTGRIPVPVLTVKGIDDATAFVELDAAFKPRWSRRAPAAIWCRPHAAQQPQLPERPDLPHADGGPAALGGRGTRPTPASIASECPALEATFGKGCAFVPEYRPAALNTRVPERAPQ